MSEPGTRAERLISLPGSVLHWTLHDDRIDFRSEAYAVPADPGRVLIDPLPLAAEPLARLAPVAAICITGAFHQRSAWRLRRELGVPVHAPRGASRLDERPDVWFDDGDRMPGDLEVWLRHGPNNPHAVFVHTREGVTTLFAADLLMRGDDGPFALVPDDHQQQPRRTRVAVEGLLTRRYDLLCPAHGAPLSGAVAEAIRAALNGGAGD